MARTAACKGEGCERKLVKEERHYHNSKIYCDDCYKKVKKSSEEYKQLMEYICLYFEIDRPTGLMLKQIKEYKEDYKFSYGGMTYTLWYIKEVENKQFITKYGVALIKYYYDVAEKYFLNQERVKKSIEENKHIENKTKVIRINNSHTLSKTNGDNNNLINIAKLINKDGD